MARCGESTLEELVTPNARSCGSLIGPGYSVRMIRFRRSGGGREIPQEVEPPHRGDLAGHGHVQMILAAAYRLMGYP